MRVSPPLFVDLDGTLIKTDLLVESFIGLCKRAPWMAVRAPLWLLRGKSYLKDRIAAQVSIDPSLLPYQAEMLAYLRGQKGQGREIHLATAANHRYAKAVARHLGLFDAVLASDEGNNLSGVRKLEAIRRMRPNGFIYAGNDHADVPIWEAADGAILVDTPDALARRVSRSKPVEARFNTQPCKLRTLLKAIRPHQWLKNFLVFLPLLPIATTAKLSMFAVAGVAFAAFSLCASSVYLLNDLSDLEADRAHPRKRNRPFASGALAPLYGVLLIPVLLVLAFGLTLLLPWKFAAILGVYWLATTAYTFVLKRHALIDVATLASLYTLRVLGGAAAIGVAPSFWILAFSMFVFFSLALTKRYTELHAMHELGREQTRGRGYNVADLQIVQLMGVASGYLSVLVMALYINSPEIAPRYQHLHLLWGVCPVLMLWVSRVWLKAARGEMTDDPLVFAAMDKMSRYLLAIAGALVVAALL
jgi:4-hydroxybenzoate polyprenyltransferase/phosphoserine phosphatase